MRLIASFLLLLAGMTGAVDLHLPAGAALAWDGALSLAFFLQHSVMERRPVKAMISRRIPTRYTGALYAIAYTVKMTRKFAGGEDYAVSKLMSCDIHGSGQRLEVGSPIAIEDCPEEIASGCELIPVGAIGRDQNISITIIRRTNTPDSDECTVSVGNRFATELTSRSRL